MGFAQWARICLFENFAKGGQKRCLRRFCDFLQCCKISICGFFSRVTCEITLCAIFVAKYVRKRVMRIFARFRNVLNIGKQVTKCESKRTGHKQTKKMKIFHVTFRGEGRGVVRFSYIAILKIESCKFLPKISFFLSDYTNAIFMRNIVINRQCSAIDETGQLQYMISQGK